MSALLALLAACGTDGDGAPVSDPSASRTTSTTEPGPAADVPPFPTKPAPQLKQGSGRAEIVFTAVRVAEHEGFDRIVLEFSGTGTPGWSVDYVDEAVLDGSGEHVTLGGDAVLDIYASGTTWPASDYYSGPRRLEPQDDGAVRDLYVGGTFEGTTQLLAGIAGSPAPFRVFALTDPSRLVVDVAH